ncbi:MAG: hypothetical protein H6Q56_103 [Deltaproteobacteria bacterium]|nr:hypothetical protein [Deltaproteobacteria bacterium]
MKRILGMLTILATTALLSVATVMGAEATMGVIDQKDQCLLVAANCANSVDSISQRIERLNKEIAKGTDVYTTDELQRLRDKLDDAVRTLDDLIRS